ncbi:tetratricopeptide repeat protein [Jiulongibacter sediminis]|uniref:tetratricopeptide repeat protein n=1 Tax=Jiulongibacter sediminis TaxID=1605367 RepID=UPI0026F162D7|nr:tetratricopeptide repeat protein [Jiulongibacter sediminis]
MRRLYTLSIVLFSLTAARAQSLELATEYYNQGEFEKAVELYEKLSRKKENSRAIHENYFNALVRLKSFDEAERYLKAEIKDFPELIVYKADLAYLYEISDQTERAEEAYQNLIEEASGTDAYVYQLQNFFYRTNKMNTLIEMLLRSRERSKSLDKHNIQLARAYLYAGKKKEMLEEVFSYGISHPQSDYVQRTIQDNIKDEAEIDMLQKLLYAKIQQNPELVYYNEILIWHFIQLGEFGRAFTQERALDRRLGLGGVKVYELANLAYKNNQYRDAARMYQYVLNEYPDADYYAYARRLNIQCREEIIKNTFPLSREDIIGLIEQYESLLEDLGKTPKTMDALRNMALLHAFYLDDHDKAISILEDAIANAGSNFNFKDQCKLDLGDIYILKDEPWEATLLYMQVEKSQKEDHLGEIAKLKNAKMYYYTGEFELSKEVLDILKKATTREIANDAMHLSLLIQDNLGLDTTEAAMRAYAGVDLLLFQNKNTEALHQLDSLFEIYKSHSLADEILWLRGKTHYRLDHINQALHDFNAIVENYKFDILADDSLYMLAKIYDQNLGDKNKAMELYRQILSDFPGSIYGSEARKKYRELRGDFVF